MNRPALHFIGFRDDRYWSAVKVWGRPDFIHRRDDRRARREFAPGDIIIRATGDDSREPARHSADDITEPRL